MQCCLTTRVSIYTQPKYCRHSCSCLLYGLDQALTSHVVRWATIMASYYSTISIPGIQKLLTSCIYDPGQVCVRTDRSTTEIASPAAPCEVVEVVVYLHKFKHPNRVSFLQRSYVSSATVRFIVLSQRMIATCIRRFRGFSVCRSAHEYLLCATPQKKWAM